MLTTLIENSPLLFGAIVLSIGLLSFGLYRVFFYRPKKSMYFSAYPEEGSSVVLWASVGATVLLIVVLLLAHFRISFLSTSSTLTPVLTEEKTSNVNTSNVPTTSAGELPSYKIVALEQLQDLNDCERRYIKSYLDQNVSEPLREYQYQQYKRQCEGNPSLSDLSQARLDQLSILAGATKKSLASGQSVLMPPPPEFLPTSTLNDAKKVIKDKEPKSVVAKASLAAASAASAVMSPASSPLQGVVKKDSAPRQKDTPREDVKSNPPVLNIEPVELSLEKEGT